MNDLPDLSIDQIFKALEASAVHAYGTEPVNELEHALQCADLAFDESGDEELAAAALLHDIGRVAVRQEEISDTLAPDAMGQVEAGAQGHHEAAHALLHGMFSDRLVSCIRMHVGAKRYLSTVEPGYYETLSAGSVETMKMQGGPMSEDECAAFESATYFKDAVRLRRWDDRAKEPGKPTRPLSDWRALVERVATNGESARRRA